MKVLFYSLLFICLYGCGNRPSNITESNKYPNIYPDYQNVTIPINIAPLNFKVIDSEKIEVEFKQGNATLLVCRGDGAIDIPIKKWRSLLEENSNSELQVKVFASKNGEWKGYKPFKISIVSDSIDPYLAYRLIEPGYELGKNLGLFQRELSTFNESSFVDPKLTTGSCVNCHAFCNYSPKRFMFHSRWDNSGTIIVEPNNIRKVNTKTDELLSAGAYRMWHPSGKYIAFSHNQTHQAFHAFSNKIVEVYDLCSGLMIYDVKKNRVITDSRFTKKDSWKTFPAWSPDGKFLYFCEAKPQSMPTEYKEVKYQLYRVAFDEEKGELLNNIEKIATLKDSLKSIVFPTISPDGRYLLYTAAESGTFPIWHKDADLGMVDLNSGKSVDISRANSSSSDSYHAWSSNGRWISFSSRRSSDLYTNVYFVYFDKDGNAHKPFILPQESPDFYTYFLKSYNIPEFLKGPIELTPYELEEAMKMSAKNAI